MAHGFYCTKCGFCETAHSDPYIPHDEPKKEGYKLTLAQCNGYRSPDPKQEKHLWEGVSRDEYERKMHPITGSCTILLTPNAVYVF